MIILKCADCKNVIDKNTVKCPFCGAEIKKQKSKTEAEKETSKEKISTSESSVPKDEEKNDSLTYRIIETFITILAIIALILCVNQKKELSVSHMKSAAQNSLGSELSEIEQLIKAEDYLALNALVRSNGFDNDKYDDEDYFQIFKLSSAYADIYRRLMLIIGDDSENYTWNSQFLKQEIELFEDQLAMTKVYPDNCSDFVQHIAEDEKLLLNKYLLIDEATYAEIIIGINQNELSALNLIERKINELYKEK